jgi:predicted RNA binding protein YcfA (HicA-like mRNA interferase family)
MRGPAACYFLRTCNIDTYFNTCYDGVDRGDGMRDYSSTDIIRLLRIAGWEQFGQRGSHVYLKHESLPGKITVPHPRRSLKRKTVLSIVKQAGLDPAVLR